MPTPDLFVNGDYSSELFITNLQLMTCHIFSSHTVSVNKYFVNGMLTAHHLTDRFCSRSFRFNIPLSLVTQSRLAAVPWSIMGQRVNFPDIQVNGSVVCLFFHTCHFCFPECSSPCKLICHAPSALQTPGTLY